MKKTILSFILALSLIAPVFAQNSTKLNPVARQAAEQITATQLRDYLTFVASDEMEGRDTPSRGLNLTAKFIALQLSRWGIKPAGDNNTYFQKIDLVANRPDPAKAQAELNGQPLVYGTDFFTNEGTGSVNNAALVFGGNGWMIKSKNIDALQNADVRGKVVVIYSEGLPQGITFQNLAASGKRGTDWADPLTNAQQKGAVGVILVSTPNGQSNWDRVRAQRERGTLKVERMNEDKQEATIPIVYLSRQTAEKLFQGETSDLNQITSSVEANTPLTAFSLNANKKLNFNVAARKDVSSTQNVVGMIEGSDPNLKAEIVAIGAHYDHVGTNPNAPGADKIWNGADDDGSGTVGVLSIAEAVAKSAKKPKRSILFVWHAGEEKGLWGSDYFTRFPTVPLKNIVTQLNIDMIGRSKKEGDTNPANKELSGPNEIYVIGSKMMSTELGNTNEAINNAYLKLAYNYRYDDPKDPNRFFFRSDHFNYAKNGIPIIFYFDGVHEDYHRPGDDVSKIDFDKMQKVTRTIFLTMWAVADLKTRPVVDKQLPAELTRRN